MIKAFLKLISAIAIYVSGVITFFGGLLWIFLYVIEYEKLSRLTDILIISLVVLVCSSLLAFLTAILDD